MQTTDPVRENRVRRAAERAGLILIKILRRATNAPGAGRYVLVRPTETLSLEQVEAQLGLDGSES